VTRHLKRQRVREDLLGALIVVGGTALILGLIRLLLPELVLFP
jgi:hypothetical protein